MRPGCPALLVSAPASGQGKTSVTAALARWHQRRGRRVQVFKSGPDFLDPMILARASGRPCYQLDLWMGSAEEVDARVRAALAVSDLVLVEGAMGLFDGAPSSADLAMHLGLPVMAVLDASGMAQTFGALATGLARYRDGLRVFGVAANRIGSDYHARLLAESLPPDLAWLGALPRGDALALPERHLGLVAAAELAALGARLDALADAWEPHASEVLPPPMRARADTPNHAPGLEAVLGMPGLSQRLAGTRIAIARDAAFCFLYPANLDLLQAAGAELRWFSPLAGDPLPDCDAVWLPGGYPELHLAALAARTDLHAALRSHVETGRPLLAECGGMLCLLDGLTDIDGQRAAMAGLLPGEARMQSRLAGLGLQAVSLPEGALRGHTFHYASAEIREQALATASNPNRGPSREAVWRRGRMTASFVHFYFPSAPAAALALFLP